MIPKEMKRKAGHYRLPFRLQTPTSDIVHVEEPYWKWEPYTWRTMCGKSLRAGSMLFAQDRRRVSCEVCRARINERALLWFSLLDEAEDA